MLRYVEILLRHWVRFTAILILVPIVITAISLAFFKSYRATADLWVDSPALGSTTVNPPGWSQYLTPAQNQKDSLDQMLSTRSFVDELGARLHRDGTVTDDSELASVEASLGGSLKTAAAGSHLLTLTYSSDRQAVCIGVLADVIALFQDRLAALQQDQEKLSTSFLESQLSAARANLTKSQNALQQYVAAHPSTVISAGEPTGNAAADQLVQQVTSDQNRVTTLQSELDQSNFIGAAASTFIDTNTKVVDQPAITRGGILGDGSSLKRAGVGAAICMLGGLGYLLLMAWLDNTVLDEKEIENRLQVAVLATIPGPVIAGRAG